MKKAIAFATDAKYVMALETVVKSILLNNDDTTIYVINADIPVEWFFQYKKILANTSCRVVNVQINDEQLKWDESFSYITKISYARIMLGRLLPQEKRVLYLDGDVVVNGNLDELFALDFSQPLAASTDWINTFRFNSGVMLLNLDLWRERQLETKIFNFLEQRVADGLPGDDQRVLNAFFGKDYYLLGPEYNLQVGADAGVNPAEEYEDVEVSSSIILHYSTVAKAWVKSTLRGRDIWWHYFFQGSNDVLDYQRKRQLKRKNILFFTYQQDIPYLAELLHDFPNFNFIVAAPTKMGNMLLSKMNIPNLYLYPAVRSRQMQDIIAKSDLFLDIISKKRDENVEAYVRQRKVPSIAFDDTQSDNLDYDVVFTSGDKAGLWEYLRNFR